MCSKFYMIEKDDKRVQECLCHIRSLLLLALAGLLFAFSVSLLSLSIVEIKVSAVLLRLSFSTDLKCWRYPRLLWLTRRKGECAKISSSCGLFLQLIFKMRFYFRNGYLIGMPTILKSLICINFRLETDIFRILLGIFLKFVRWIICLINNVLYRINFYQI